MSNLPAPSPNDVVILAGARTEGQRGEIPYRALAGRRTRTRIPAGFVERIVKGQTQARGRARQRSIHGAIMHTEAHPALAAPLAWG